MRSNAAQTENKTSADPGLISLVILLRLHGIAAEAEEIRTRSDAATVGLAEMLRCATELGVRADVRCINWRRLANISLPAIAELRDGGFLIIGRIDRRSHTVLIQHPFSSQPEEIRRSELETVWDGRVFFVERPLRSALWRRLLRFAFGARTQTSQLAQPVTTSRPGPAAGNADRGDPKGLGKVRLLPKSVTWAISAVTLIAIASVPSSLGWQLPRRLSSSPSLEDRAAGLSSLAVPVLAATVEQKDVPIYLFGLGTAQAFNTVKVTSRVEGQLQKLAFKEGQDVRAGDLLAQIDPLPFQAALRQMEANLRRDEAQLRNAKLELERTISLRDYASRQNVDLRRSTVEQLEAAVEADQAQIDNAKIQLEYTVIRSPMDGRAGLRLIDEGNMIRAADPTGIVVLTQLQPIQVIFALPEEDFPKINARLLAGGASEVVAFGRDRQTVLAEGVLSTVDNIIDRKTGTFKLKAQFGNEKKTLWPGQFVNARIHIATRQRGVVVSEAAVQRGPDGPYVFVIEPDSTVAMRTIKVAQTEGGTALIENGLRPGQRVVIEGQYRLQQGTRILEVKS
jgi:multidrug efflux system membrane fusion protein